MAKIGIDLNDVVRDFINQFEYYYNKYYNKDVDIQKNPPKTFDLEKYFHFEDGKKGLYQFLYAEGAYEISAMGQILEVNLLHTLNMFYLSLEKTNNELYIISREYYKSIPATYFFLAKGCQIPNIKFYKQYEDMWNDMDIIITANPKVLRNKPLDKIGICITKSYNYNTLCDYRYGKLSDFLNDTQVLDTIIDFKSTEPMWIRFEKHIVKLLNKIPFFKKDIKKIIKQDIINDRKILDEEYKKIDKKINNL